MRVELKHHVEETKTVVMSADICFLLDVSGSMAGSSAKAMANELEWFLFDSQLLDPMDTVQIFSFNSEVEEILKPTFRQNLSRENIDALRIREKGSGGTQLWQAMNAVFDARKAFVARKREKAMEKEHRLPQKQKGFVLLVLTDGESRGSPTEVMARLQHIGTEIPQFHMHFLGIKLDEQSVAALEQVKRVNPKRCDVTNVTCSGHASHAIKDSFRTHFTRTVHHVRTAWREVGVDPTGLAWASSWALEGDASASLAPVDGHVLQQLGSQLLSAELSPPTARQGRMLAYTQPSAPPPPHAVSHTPRNPHGALSHTHTHSHTPPHPHTATQAAPCRWMPPPPSPDPSPPHPHTVPQSPARWSPPATGSPTPPPPPSVPSATTRQRPGRPHTGPALPRVYALEGPALAAKPGRRGRGTTTAPTPGQPPPAPHERAQERPPCQFGLGCRHLPHCHNYHPKAHIPCRFGAACRYAAASTCEFQHA